MAHVHTLRERFQLFETLCMVKGKSCILLIDSGCSSNMVSQYLVDKLQLPVHLHPDPSSATGLTGNCHQQVIFQCEVHFSIDNYHDTVLCDVGDMDGFHLLLGRPWQFDVDATYRGKANTYTFVKDGHKFVLATTLTPGIWPIEMPQWPSGSHQVISTPTADTQSSPPLISNSTLQNWSPPLSGRNEEENFSDSQPFGMEGDFASSDSLIQRENIFPERLGQRECDFYMRTGDCKFGTRCKFHHPKERSIPAPCPKEMSTHDPCLFYLLGRCRFGATCRYDHPCGMGGMARRLPLNTEVCYPLRWVCTFHSLYHHILLRLSLYLHTLKSVAHKSMVYFSLSSRLYFLGHVSFIFIRRKLSYRETLFLQLSGAMVPLPYRFESSQFYLGLRLKTKETVEWFTHV